MKKINIEKIYNNLKTVGGEQKANEFILNLSNELKTFQARLKKIIEVIISKYYKRISPETLIKLKEINELCTIVEKIANKKENKNDINLYFDDFKLKINNKLNQIHNSKKQESKNNMVEESLDDSLWIPKELLDVSNAINEKFQELDFSFIEGIKNNHEKNTQLSKKNNDIFQIIDDNDDDVFLINGKEVDDESFLKALKSKI